VVALFNAISKSKKDNSMPARIDVQPHNKNVVSKNNASLKSNGLDKQEYFDKKNLRSLSNAENEELEKIKTNILFQTKPFAKLNEENGSLTKIILELSFFINKKLPSF
jgi:hypothetical protein